MVRVLATMILVQISKASTTDCDHVAKALIQKFPFLKEYVSYVATVGLVCIGILYRIRGHIIYIFDVKIAIANHLIHQSLSLNE